MPGESSTTSPAVARRIASASDHGESWVPLPPSVASGVTQRLTARSVGVQSCVGPPVSSDPVPDSEIPSSSPVELESSVASVSVWGPDVSGDPLVSEPEPSAGDGSPAHPVRTSTRNAARDEGCMPTVTRADGGCRIRIRDGLRRARPRSRRTGQRRECVPASVIARRVCAGVRRTGHRGTVGAGPQRSL